MAGQTCEFEFDSPSGLGWFAVMPVPVPSSPHGIAAPLSCASQAYFFGLGPVVLTAIGAQARLSLTLPAWTAGYGLTIQGIAYDGPGNCFHATDPLAVTLQHR